MQMIPLIGQLIVLPNVVWIDLAHSPAVSLVPTWPWLQKPFPRLARRDKVRLTDFVPDRQDRPIVRSYQLLLQFWKQCWAARGWGTRLYFVQKHRRLRVITEDRRFKTGRGRGFDRGLDGFEISGANRSGC
jgi:hypothetical protein